MPDVGHLGVRVHLPGDALAIGVPSDVGTVTYIRSPQRIAHLSHRFRYFAIMIAIGVAETRDWIARDVLQSMAVVCQLHPNLIRGEACEVGVADGMPTDLHSHAFHLLHFSVFDALIAPTRVGNIEGSGETVVREATRQPQI